MVSGTACQNSGLVPLDRPSISIIAQDVFWINEGSDVHTSPDPLLKTGHLRNSRYQLEVLCD